MLGSLNPQLDKEFVFSLIATDASGNPKTAEEIEKDAIRINKAMSDLASGTRQEKAKAQLELTALYNGKDISDPAVQENLSQLKKDITGFDDFDAGTQAKLIEIDTQIDNKGVEIAALEALRYMNKATPEELRKLAQLVSEKAALEKDLASTTSSANIAAAGETEKGEESAFQKTKKSFEETKKYQKAIVQLLISTWDTGYGYGKTAIEIRDYVLTNVQNNNLISSAYSAYLNIIKKVFTLFP
jgi:hypothetical protein